MLVDMAGSPKGSLKIFLEHSLAGFYANPTKLLPGRDGREIEICC